MSEFPCPYCHNLIAESATRCQHCHADWTPRSWASRIGTFRDVIALPTAIIALIIALKDPLSDYYMKAFELDGAEIDGYSIGSELSANIQNDDKLTNIRRFLILNKGRSAASISDVISCAGKNATDKFYFITFDKEIANHRMVTVKPGEDLILDTCLMHRSEKGISFIDKENTCRIRFSDRYQEYRTFDFAFNPGILADPAYSEHVELCSPEFL